MQSNEFIVCAFYTVNTPYEEVINKCLLPSISNFNIKSDIVAINNLGNWNRNTAYKATLALEMLNKHSENIVILDADARVEQYPTLFNNIPEEYNIACHLLDRHAWFKIKCAKLELLTGTLFLRNNDDTKAIVKEWVAECSRTSEWEQRVLQRVLESKNIPVYNLPVEYCWIDSLPNNRPHPFVSNNVVIRHFQVSRDLKTIVRIQS